MPAGTPSEPSGRRRRALVALAEAAGLVCAPGLAYVVLQARIMLYTLSIDPFISTGYALDGPNLISRFGTSDYFWTRVGFTLPAHGVYALAGPVTGFFLFRYLLALVAIVPLFLLFRRAAGAGAGWITVIAVLTSSVVITGWSTDYPTAAALSYLIAGSSCLFMPATSRRARVSWAVAAGVFFGLAIGCGLIAGFAVAGALAGRLATIRRSSWRSTASAVVLAGGGAVLALGVLAVATKAYLGHADFLSPQLAALQRFQSPVQIAFFHSSTWQWLVDDIYVLVPPAILGAWLVAAWPVVRRSVPTAEIGFATATAVTYALYVIDQFALQSWALEYWLYADLLWALTIPLLVFTMLRIAGTRRDGNALAVVAVGAAVLACPLIFRAFRDHLHLRFGVALAAALVPAAVALLARLRPARSVLLGAAAVVSAVASVLVIGGPIFVLFPGQVGYATPDFGTTLFGSSQPALDEYAVVTQLHDVVPSAQQLPGELALWLPRQQSHLISLAAAQYIATRYELPDALPVLTAADAAYLRARNVHLLVMLSDTGAEFAAARSSVDAARVRVTMLEDTVLSAGAEHLHVTALRLSYAS